MTNDLTRRAIHFDTKTWLAVQNEAKRKQTTPSVIVNEIVKHTLLKVK